MRANVDDRCRDRAARMPAIVFRRAARDRPAAHGTPPGDAHVIARLAASAEEGGAPLTVRFDASGSRAATGAPLAFAWVFGDGSGRQPAGAVVEHTYTRRGTFRARVVVSDGSQHAIARVTIVVEGHGHPDAPWRAGDDGQSDGTPGWDAERPGHSVSGRARESCIT